jgi:uncharacterized protein with von Willebrand factor type A (vWA) domain
MSTLLAEVVRFARELRSAGVGVTPPQIERFVRALELVGFERAQNVRDAARATLATSRDEADRIDAVFDRVWLRRKPAPPPVPPPAPPRPTAQLALIRQPGRERDDRPQDVSDRSATWSDTERLRAKHFDRLTPEEDAALRRLMERATWPTAERRTRRYRRSPVGRSLDWRRTIRAAVRHSGEILIRHYRAHTTRPRRLVVLVDVSGSMERFSRAILTFVHLTALGARRRRHRTAVEVFVFGTRLTRVTRAFATRGVDDALAAAAALVPDWSGGTRIGESLHRFNNDWARRVLNRGPDVILVSDGWDQGEPEIIAHEAARLRRNCHRLFWLHPLAGTPGFEARTRGLIAALPFVDALLPGGTLAELEESMRRLRAGSAAHRGEASPDSPEASRPASPRVGADPRHVRQPPSGRSR